MTVTPNRKSYTGRCAICSKPFDTTRPDALYCTNSCSMKAYRRRKAEERIGAAAERRRRAAHEHQAVWERFFVSSSKVTRRQAAELYSALHGLGRLNDLTSEQMELTDLTRVNVNPRTSPPSIHTAPTTRQRQAATPSLRDR